MTASTRWCHDRMEIDDAMAAISVQGTGPKPTRLTSEVSGDPPDPACSSDAHEGHGRGDHVPGTASGSGSRRTLARASSSSAGFMPLNQDFTVVTSYRSLSSAAAWNALHKRSRSAPAGSLGPAALVETDRANFLPAHRRPGTPRHVPQPRKRFAGGQADGVLVGLQQARALVGGYLCWHGWIACSNAPGTIAKAHAKPHARAAPRTAGGTWPNSPCRRQKVYQSTHSATRTARWAGSCGSASGQGPGLAVQSPRLAARERARMLRAWRSSGSSTIWPSKLNTPAAPRAASRMRRARSTSPGSGA